METQREQGFDYLAIIRGMWRRHKRLMAAIFVVVATPLVALTFFRKPPVFESTATIMFEPSTAARIPNLEFPGGGGIGTTMIILRSRSLSESVVEALPKESFDELLTNAQYTDYMLVLSNTVKAWLGKPPTVLSPQQRALAELQQARIYIGQGRGNPGLVSLTGYASNPRVAMDLVNTHIQVLLSRTRNVNQEDARKAREFLEAQSQQVKESLARGEDALAKFQQQRGRLRLSTETEFDLAKLSQTENSLSEVQASRQVLGSRMAGLRQSLEGRLKEAKNKEAQKEDSAASQSSETLAKLNEFRRAQERLTRLEEKLVALRDRYTDAHPLVHVTQEDVANWQARVAQLAREIPTTPSKDANTPRPIPPGQMERAEAQQQLAILQAEDAGLQTRAETLKVQIDRLRGRLRNLNQDEVEFSNLRRTVEGQRNLLTILSDKLMGARIQEQGESSVVRIIDPASFPVVPTQAQTRKQVLFIIALAGGLAFAAAFGLEFWRLPVETESDVQKATGLPVLGSVGVIGSPMIDSKGNPKRLLSSSPVHLPSAPMPTRIHMELYRAIRATVETERLKSPFRSILITSPGPNEGKSTTALNLAHVFQEFGRRVLVVEADLRRPSIHRSLSLVNKPGLVDFFTGAATFEQVCRQLPSGGTVIPGQTAREDPATMLASPRVRELLELSSPKFDLVLVDSAPVLAVPDNLLLVAGLDRVILVVKASHTSKRDLRRTQRALEHANAQILGVVLNQANPQDVQYYKPRYRKYYKPAETAPPPEPARRFASLWRRIKKG